MKAFKLKARSKVTVFACLHNTITVTPSKAMQLSQGKKAAFAGILAFERELDVSSALEDISVEDEQLMRVAKLIPIRGGYCISYGEVIPATINCGQIGYGICL
jgi:hypothetical protein